MLIDVWKSQQCRSKGFPPVTYRIDLHEIHSAHVHGPGLDPVSDEAVQTRSLLVINKRGSMQLPDNDRACSLLPEELYSIQLPVARRTGLLAWGHYPPQAETAPPPRGVS